MTKNDTFILTPDPSRVMEGLRDTGYTFNTAMADIVDNSISANATKIDIQILLLPSNEIIVLVADNGCGMDLDGLKNAMTYGSAKRIDPKSLGKFGLGLKTASTAFCKSLSLLSKTNESTYHKVCWDIDHVARTNEWELLVKPIDSDEVEVLEETTNGNSGTLVIWEKVDRLLKGQKGTVNKAYKRIIDELKQHFGMVYQRYLDPKFKLTKDLVITINGEKVSPWDPFCLNEPNTITHSEFDQPVELNGEKCYFHIAAYILPRPEEFSSIEAKKNANISNTMAGFYVYREGRLIHNGDWLGMYVPESHVSLLRVDFSFNHELDEAFNVDIKKSKILLSEEIYDFLKTNYLPAPRSKAVEVYNSAQAKKSLVRTAQNGTHVLSNKTLEEQNNSVVSSAISILNKEKGEVEISNSNGTSLATIKILDNPNTTKHHVEVQEKDNDDYLWEPGLINNEHAVIINARHPFYFKVYSRVKDPNVASAFDFLLWSFVEAEFSTYTPEVKEQYRDMRYQISTKLKKLVNSIPDIELDGE